MATKLGDLTVGADGSWSSGPHTMTAGSKSVTLRRKSDGAVLVTRGFTVAAAGPVSYVGAGTLVATTGSGGSETVSAPAGVQSGDILIMWGAGTILATPAGWTEKVAGALYWKRSTGGSDDATATTDDGGGEGGLANLRMYAFRGCPASGDPFDASDAAASSFISTSSITGSALTIAAGSMICLLVKCGQRNATSVGGSVDTLVAGGTSSPTLHMAYDSTPPATGGAQSAPTMTLSALDGGIKLTISLKKA